MVVKCFNCESLLKVNRDKDVEGEQVSVRCPKCGSEGLIGEPQSPKDPNAALFLETGVSETKVTVTETNLEKDQSSTKTTKQVKAGELTLPEDAFRDFRFPAEIESTGKNSSSWNHRTKLITLLIASILVVFFFASLVNVILPGLPPAGVERVTSYPDTEAR